MSRYLMLCCTLLMLALPAGEAFAINVADAVITTAVVDREPVDNVKVFPVKNGNLYCFTRITGASEPVVVYHAWFRGRQLMSRVGLPVESTDWRTWSTMDFRDDWSGGWRVEIQDAAGNVLQEVSFELH